LRIDKGFSSPILKNKMGEDCGRGLVLRPAGKSAGAGDAHWPWICGTCIKAPPSRPSPKIRRTDFMGRCGFLSSFCFSKWGRTAGGGWYCVRQARAPAVGDAHWPWIRWRCIKAPHPGLLPKSEERILGEEGSPETQRSSPTNCTERRISDGTAWMEIPMTWPPQSDQRENCVRQV
jgi:hypothetical protein